MLLYFSSSWAALPRWRLSCRLPGCPPPRFRPPPCPPRPRRRPPCLLLIKCLRPYEVVAVPLFASSGRAALKRAPDPLVPVCAIQKRQANGRLRRGLGRDALSAFLGGAGPAQDHDVVRRTANAKRFSITATLAGARGRARRGPAQLLPAARHGRGGP